MVSNDSKGKLVYSSDLTLAENMGMVLGQKEVEDTDCSPTLSSSTLASATSSR